MFKEISMKTTKLLIENNIIDQEDKNIYEYGFETLIYFTVNILIALIIGLIFGKLLNTIVFLICYCTIRQFSGGYHANSYGKCTLTFVFIYLVTIFISHNLNILKFKYILILISIINSFIIWNIAPLEHRNNPLSSNDKVHYKKISTKISILISIINILSLLFNILQVYIVFSIYATFWISVLLIIGFYKRE
ncbi:accessory gene regulator [[Clostridium] sordellii]|uniref:accessory gene regulator ArgB-like protein n=1 Tax=Paraclostridium sordellii TaxID=1505 RepID=UPI000540745C|nr:accessory gene regulator B family protein [Paeniclostridium sordellii]CEK36649.1 accessory gene regulator,putative accessory gene regulator protein,Membrane protein putatively involved in post-translational modification of the autoinducing quorum-sensing peptide,Accessory gene regulator B (plasmid) [[Clostridium] sordellii] [Paeniclostridium sordellii]CEP46142.1 accessory gene regulator [[Clostridium] sordellii] [Paeniclostridium sordellii]